MGLRRQADRQHYVISRICDIIKRRAVVFKCITCSTFDDVLGLDDVILPLGWVNFLGESQSRIYPNICTNFGCSPTVVSKKKGGGYKQTDRRTLQLYIVHCISHPALEEP